MNEPVAPMRAGVLAAVLSLALGACSSDGGPAFGSSSTTVAPPTTTTTATTTTAATTTTTTATTSTTTTLVPPSLPLEFSAAGLNIVMFGATPDDTLTIVGAYLGATPSVDSGWVPAVGDYGVCPGNEYRQVEYGGLVLRFTDAGIFRPAGTRQFFGYGYTGDEPDITTPAITVGWTVAQLQTAYPAADIRSDDPLVGNSFTINGAAPGELLRGTLTGVGAADTITYLAGGGGCGE